MWPSHHLANIRKECTSISVKLLNTGNSANIKQTQSLPTQISPLSAVSYLHVNSHCDIFLHNKGGCNVVYK